LVQTSQSYGGDVTVTLEGLPPGASVTPQVIGGGGMISVMVETTSATPLGQYPLVLRATGGKLVHSLTATLDVQARPPFALTLSPVARRVRRGGTARYAVRVAARKGFREPVSLWVASLPAGCTAQLKNYEVAGAGRTELVVRVARDAPLGRQSLMVRGESGATVTDAMAALIVGGR
jgi:hypothetical protein